MIKSFFNANNVSEINAIYMTKEFQNVIAGNREIVVYIPGAKEFLLISFTKGENLLRKFYGIPHASWLLLR